MENLVTIVEVGAYSERQYQKQDGSSEYFKSRGVVMKPVLSEPTLHRERFLETSYMGRPEPSDAS